MLLRYIYIISKINVTIVVSGTVKRNERKKKGLTIIIYIYIYIFFFKFIYLCTHTCMRAHVLLRTHARTHTYTQNFKACNTNFKIKILMTKKLNDRNNE